MASLLQKISANAADRLTLPPNRKPAQELTRYKNFLKVENHRLKMLHRAGSGGLEICSARAVVLDILLQSILEAVWNSLPEEIRKTERHVAFVGLGGYGRGELNPHSDIDIMFLFSGELVIRGKPAPALAALVDGVLYTLWDIGLKVGHSVRSIEDCLRIANSDMQAKTSLIEARLIWGSEQVFKEMQAVLLAKAVRGQEDAYIEARLQDQAARRNKFGNSATMLEPNIKSGCGGLRDYQNLLWMAFFKYRVRTLPELQAQGLLNPSERKQLEAAYDFLLRVRTELHYHAHQAQDVLPKAEQPAVASNLGYTDRSPLKRMEEFMRDLYTHTRNIYLLTRTLEQRLALLPHPQKSRTLRDLFRTRRRESHLEVEGLKIGDRQIQAASAAVFQQDPRRLMRVFLLAQQRGLELHPDLAQSIRQQLALVDRGFLRDTHVRDTFLEILNQRGNVAPIARSMHEVGLLGKYLPEFGRLTCLVQHEFYHQYAADEHTLRCLEKVDQVWEAEKPPYSRYAEAFRNLDRPWILYFALLLHDSGKAARTGRHAEVGGTLAAGVAQRLGLDEHSRDALRWIIENHLLMAQVSQRRDLDDPAVIEKFASQVSSPDHLAFLTLHTFADSQATSGQFWTEFKDSLLWMLYHRTLEYFRGGGEYTEAETRQRELLLDEVRRLLAPQIGDDEIHGHFENLPPRYFRIHSAEQVADDLSRTHQFMHYQLAEEEKALTPIITWRDEPDRGYTAVDVCTWSRTGLFSTIAGSFTAAGLNILSAEIFSRNDGIVLDTFFVTAAKTGLLPGADERQRFEECLSGALRHELDLGKVISSHRRAPPLYKPPEGDRIPTRIHLDNNMSENRTVVEVETEDRVGLLYAISRVMAELRLDISVAKISTEKGAAIDTFYVSEEYAGKIQSPERQQLVVDRLHEAIARLDSETP